MLLTRFLCACLFILSCAGDDPEPEIQYVDGLEGHEDLVYEEFFQKRTEELKKIFPVVVDPCNVPGCSDLPCDESGPPPFCPRNVTLCRSGCACIEYCKDPRHTTYCYQVKFCRTPRRFSPDDDFFLTSTKKLIE